MAEVRSERYALTGATGYDALEKYAPEPGIVWLHVSARQPLIVALLRDVPFVYYGHFSNGRFRPCAGQDTCIQCAQHAGGKVRAVFSVYDVVNKKSGILEVSDDTAREVKNLTESWGQARGMVVSFRKEGGKQNGTIHAQSNNQCLRSEELPDGPDPAYILRKQWSEPERLPAGVSRRF